MHADCKLTSVLWTCSRVLLVTAQALDHCEKAEAPHNFMTGNLEERCPGLSTQYSALNVVLFRNTSPRHLPAPLTASISVVSPVCALEGLDCTRATLASEPGHDRAPACHSEYFSVDTDLYAYMFRCLVVARLHCLVMPFASSDYPMMVPYSGVGSERSPSSLSVYDPLLRKLSWSKKALFVASETCTTCEGSWN